MEKVDAVVIGAGIVGLAIASEIVKKDREIYVLEKETAYGQSTSSRNSEVVHTDIYYPSSSLKAELCVKANPIIYKIYARSSRDPATQLRTSSKDTRRTRGTRGSST